MEEVQEVHILPHIPEKVLLIPVEQEALTTEVQAQVQASQQELLHTVTIEVLHPPVLAVPEVAPIEVIAQEAQAALQEAAIAQEVQEAQEAAVVHPDHTLLLTATVHDHHRLIPDQVAQVHPAEDQVTPVHQAAPEDQAVALVAALVAVLAADQAEVDNI